MLYITNWYKSLNGGDILTNAFHSARNAVESVFGVSKRKYCLDRIMAHLEETTKCAIIRRSSGVSVKYFIADGSIATYQTLPWNHRGWHCGSGSKGSGNDTHIGFEICEDNLNDGDYFNKVYTEAAELCVYLCKQYRLTEKDIICHYEGRRLGIASNHGDVMHWFPKHGKTMDTFRSDVKKLLTPSAAGSKGTYSVQVGSFSDKGNADAMLSKVKAAGFTEAFIKYIE